MLNIIYIQLKTTQLRQLRKNFFTINKVVSRKIDDNKQNWWHIFHREAHTQQDFRQRILNLSGSLGVSHMYLS